MDVDVDVDVNVVVVVRWSTSMKSPRQWSMCVRNVQGEGEEHGDVV
jgi:hypothetical protein